MPCSCGGMRRSGLAPSNIASIPGMKDFLKHSQLFIKEGVYWEGRIRLTGTNRVLCGFLTNRKNKVSDITLKYEKE